MNCTIRVVCLLATVGAGISSDSSTAQTCSTADQSERTVQTEPEPTHGNKAQRQKYETIVLRGKVVELGPYLSDRYQVSIDEDAGKSVVMLVTDDDEAHPLVKDVRSRGFWMDKRLRDRPMELHVQKLPGLSFVRLIDVYSLKNGKRYRVDYWCAICAITTYEPGPCPCCQDEIELRERPVDEIKPGE